MSRSRSGTSLLLLLLLCVAPTRADEARKRRVADLVAVGTRHFQAGEYDEAVKALEAAYALEANPLFLFNIAQAQRKAGRPAEALAGYRRFLAVAPSSPLAPEAEQRVAELSAPPPAPVAPVAPIIVQPHQEPPPAPPTEMMQLHKNDQVPAPVVVQPHQEIVQVHQKDATPSRRPVYRRAGFWIALASAAVLIGGGVALGVLLAPRDPSTTLGVFTLHFPSP